MSWSSKLVAEQPFDGPPITTHSATDAGRESLRGAGATLPSRDAVDARIVDQIRSGSGKVIGKETDLPELQRWPDYHSLPPLPDADQDGLPDFWEAQFSLNPQDKKDSMKTALDGYTFIEHYLNNSLFGSDAARQKEAIVHTCARISRATDTSPGIISFEVHRRISGSLSHPKFKITGDATAADFTAEKNLPEGTTSPSLTIHRKPGATSGRTVVVELLPDPAYHIGCPSRAMVVIK